MSERIYVTADEAMTKLKAGNEKFVSAPQVINRLTDVPWAKLNNRQQRTCIHTMTCFHSMTDEVWVQVLAWILARRDG